MFNQLAACQDCAHEYVCQDCTTRVPGPARATVVPLPGKRPNVEVVEVQLYPNTSESPVRVTISNRPRKYSHLSARSVSLAETFSRPRSK
jgi:hypothetical protein